MPTNEHLAGQVIEDKILNVQRTVSGDYLIHTR
jgi:hypothetical protein